MDRVHGMKIIRRSENVKSLSNYHLYKEQLVKDFKNLCGYCGKNRIYFYDKFQIDHFKPQKKYNQFKNDYYNLVLACPICNRNKSDDWPTNNPNIPHDNNMGYVDPASKEFDEVFYRDKNGNICSNTNYGNYMIKRLKFDIRPIQLLWKLEQLYAIKEKINKKISWGNASKEVYEDFVEISNVIDELSKFLRYKEGE